MDWTKFAIASVIGGVVYFFAGWLVFGIVLMDYTQPPADVAAAVMIPMEEFKMSYMIISCLIIGAFYSLIFSRWANITTLIGGFKTAATLGVMISLAVGFSMASMFKLNTIDQILLNAVGEIVASGLTGAAIGWYLGRK